MKLKTRLLYILICGFFTMNLSAQEAELVIETLNSNQINIGAELAVEDINFFTPNSVVEDPAIEIVVGVLDDVIIDPSIWFTYSITVKVTTINKNTGDENIPFSGEENTPYSETLNIEYSPLGNVGNIKDIDIKKINGAQALKITIENIEVYDKTNNQSLGAITPGNVYLELKYSGGRYRRLTTVLPNINHQYLKNTITGEALATVDDADKIRFDWNTITGAVAYDLEWTWVDSYDADENSIKFNKLDFKRNNTRVRTSDNSYKIPLIYSDGFLIYRVRAIGYRPDDYIGDNNFEDVGKLYYGKWTSGISNETYVTDWLDFAIVKNHDANKNWQFQASYAENGKKKEVVSYFDGTLRNRQTVTKINTDDTAIVGEVIYDNQGRPAIEILPAPAQISNLGFHDAFNVNLNNNTYTHYDFDWSDPNTPNSQLGVTTNVMSATSGASLYYSQDITLKTEDKDYFIPDAQSYPFSQIQYTNDNTGRIKRKSGVGLTHQLGNNHEMKYYYGTPKQKELNRLFGYKVGYNKYYKKNTVIDPNGQISVSYLDPQGRTIATALSGNGPTPMTQLDEAINGNHTTIDEDLLNKLTVEATDTDVDNNYRTSSGNFGSFQDGLSFSGNHFVTNSNDILAFTYNSSLGKYTICNTDYPFVYDLSVGVINEYGEEISTSLDDLNGAVSIFNNQIGSINGNTEPYTFSFQTTANTLTIGNYTVNKTIKVNEGTFNSNLDAFLNDENCILPPSYFNLNLLIDDCALTTDDCASFIAEFSTRDAFVQARLIEITNQLIQNAAPAPAPALTESQIQAYTEALNNIYDTKIETCESLNAESVNNDEPGTFSFTAECKIASRRLLQDFYPGEQYAVFENITGEVIEDQFSIFNDGNNGTNNSYLPNTASLSLPLWKHPHGINEDTGNNNYLNEYGEIAYVEVQALLNSDGTYTYSPEIDPSFLNDYLTNGAPTILNEDGNIDVKPNHLLNEADFILNWEYSWSNALLFYHPEVGYTSYFNEICSTLGNTNLTYTNAPTQLSSSAYDEFLKEIVYQDDQSNTIQILGNSNLETIFSNQKALLDFDPFFNTSYINVNSIVNNTVSIDNSYPSTNITIGSTSYNIDGELSARKALMTHAMEFDYDGTGYSMWQFAYKNVACGEGALFECNIPTSISGVLSQLTAEQQEEYWTTYRTMYLSLKGKVIYVFSNVYAKQNGFYNGCIEEVSSNPFNVLTPYPSQISNIIQGYATANGTPTGVCYGANANLFIDKERRFIPIDYVFGTTDINEDNNYIDIANDADYLYYEGTGNCPITLHLSNFLNGFFTHQEAQIPEGNNYYDNAPYLTTQLYTALGGVIDYNNANEPLMGTDGIKIFTNTNTSGVSELAISIGDSNDLDSSSSNGETCAIKLTSAGTTTYNWSNYGVLNGEWYISQVQDLVYVASQNVGEEQGFAFLAHVIENGNINNPIEVVFNGLSCINVGICGPDISPTDDGYFDADTDLNYNEDADECEERKELFGIALTNIINELNANNELYSATAINLSDYTSYTESFLPEFFNDNDLLSTYVYNTSNVLPHAIQIDSSNIFYFELPDFPSIANFSEVESIEFLSDTLNITLEFTGGTIQPPYNVNYTAEGNTLTNSRDKQVNFNCNEDDCIAQPVAPVACGPAWQLYLQTVGLDADSNSISDHIPNFELIELTEEQFCNIGYKYSIAHYIEYVNAFNLTVDGIDSPQFISFYQFGSNALGPGHPQTSQYVNSLGNLTDGAIQQYVEYINTTTDLIPLNWLEYVNDDYMTYNTACPVFISINTPEIILETTDCELLVENIQLTYANDLYEQYITERTETFTNAYLNAAMNDLVENFDLSYADKEYQYTLYYYDQSGNLMQTVPPEGVDRLVNAQNDAINSARETNGVSQAPNHILETRYKYNSLNQLVYQNTPDGKDTRFAYDRLGRIVMSQNAIQSQDIEGFVRFSYTSYDPLGRINEAGELKLRANEFEINPEGRLVLLSTLAEVQEVNENGFPDNLSVDRTDVTVTIYDDIFNEDIINEFNNYNAQNNRNRVTAVLHYPIYPSESNLFDNALFYSYDIHGNVKELITYINTPDLVAIGQQIKKVEYNYDLISGNVNTVTYQKNQVDQFIHSYLYDADNRIVEVKTSTNGVIWEKEAVYDYYKHGPLARVLIGDKKVQGLDYVYTIQGWLKGVNSQGLNPSDDMGQDGHTTNPYVAKDVFGFTLSYFNNDYISNNTARLLNLNSQITSSTNNLYNGNIKQMTTSLTGINQQKLATQSNSYVYDQLNRISSSASQTITQLNTGSFTVDNDLYNTSYTYDKNGNLQTLNRVANGQNMDRLDYFYDDVKKNRLLNVKDNVSDTAFDVDIDSQVSNNYEYDDIGQLIKDNESNIDKINWTVSGKVKDIIKVGGEIISFNYDGLGNRISKTVDKSNTTERGDIKTTYYVRDAQGNVLSVYSMFIDGDGEVNEGPSEYDLFLGNASISSTELLQAINNILKGDGVNYTVQPGGDVTLQAGNSIVLKPGFTALSGSKFIAEIKPFNNQPYEEEGFTLKEHHIYGSSRLGLQEYIDFPIGNTLANKQLAARVSETSSASQRNNTLSFTVCNNCGYGFSNGLGTSSFGNLEDIELNLTSGDTYTLGTRIKLNDSQTNTRTIYTLLDSQQSIHTNANIIVEKTTNGTDYTYTPKLRLQKTVVTGLSSSYITTISIDNTVVLTPNIDLNDITYTVNVLGNNNFDVSLVLNGQTYTNQINGGLTIVTETTDLGLIGQLQNHGVVYASNFDMCNLNYTINNVSRDFSFINIGQNPVSNGTVLNLPNLDVIHWVPSCGLDPDVDNDTVLNVDEDLNGNDNFDDDDTDNDGTPNYLDTDDDNDGILTISEVLDGDTDGDGIPNYLDADDDGDGIPTAQEDLNNDGNYLNDDSDNDGIPNYLDNDDDNDSVLTIDEYNNNGDFDGDGIPNYLDVDDDNDTVLTINENPLQPGDTGYVLTHLLDTDNDGSPNYLDIDDDGDGYITQEEDENGNGNPADDDTDADGHLDFLDPADNNPLVPGITSLATYNRLTGDKRYELSNHLGNVLQVITDRKIVDNGAFTAEVVAYNDYYPFGMLLPNRNGSEGSYRYGFQGQEKDDEVKGEGNSLNYKYRMHDARIGRFFAVDPLSHSYPHYSPYSFSGNKVIHAIEFEGLEEIELFHRTDAPGAAGIFSNNFDAKYTDNGKFHFFSIKNTADGAGASVAKAPINLKIKLDVSDATAVTRKQYSKWFNEALSELKYQGPRGSLLPTEIQSRADAIRKRKLWKYMLEEGKDLYKIYNGKGNFIAATDDVLINVTPEIIEGESQFSEFLIKQIDEIGDKAEKVAKNKNLKRLGYKGIKLLAKSLALYGAYVESIDLIIQLSAIVDPGSVHGQEVWRNARENATTIGHYNTGPFSLNPSEQKEADKKDSENQDSENQKD